MHEYCVQWDIGIDMSLNRVVREELSGSVAKSFVAQISRYNRIQASTMYHEAAEYVKGELLNMGLESAVIEQFPADGAVKYWTHISPVGWTVTSAEVRLVEPWEKLIVTYEDVPQCLHTYSDGTEPQGVTAELVDVGSGSKPADYEGKTVEGKFVLATGRAKRVHEEAVFRRGAAGVITDTITFEVQNIRESIDIPDAHAYQSIWPTAEELSKVKFGFSLSKRQGNHLRTLLKTGKPVKLNAKVEARLFPGNLDIVAATIPGTSRVEQEVLLIAHLCHPKPSANDNASGSGLLLEIARTISSLIAKSKIQRPSRTIRFLWVPETFGSIAYLHGHQDLPARIVAGLNLDMVGQNQELCRSTLNLDRTPDSLPSFLNDLVFGIIEKSVKEFDASSAFGSTSTFRYSTTAFSGGSDHAEFTDSTIGVPCVMLLQWPDLYYHTSLDTIDKVSEDSLRRVGWIASVAVLTLANAGAEEAFSFAAQTASRGMSRIEDAAREAVLELVEKKKDAKFEGKLEELAGELAETKRRHAARIEHVIWREQRAVRSVVRLGESAELNAFVNEYCEDIEDLGKQEIARLRDVLGFVAGTLSLRLPVELKEVQNDDLKMIPRRLFKGTLSLSFLRKGLGEVEFEWYRKVEEEDREFGKKMAEMLNFMDGERSLYEILKAVSSEYDEMKPERAVKIVRDLEKLKVVVLG
jgi:aminopeptidase YwaD